MSLNLIFIFSHSIIYLQLSLQLPSIKSQFAIFKTKSIQDRHDANVERSDHTNN